MLTHTHMNHTHKVQNGQLLCDFVNALSREAKVSKKDFKGFRVKGKINRYKSRNITSLSFNNWQCC